MNFCWHRLVQIKQDCKTQWDGCLRISGTSCPPWLPGSQTPNIKTSDGKAFFKRMYPRVSPYLADTPGKRDLDFVGTKSWSKGIFCLIHLLFITGLKSYAWGKSYTWGISEHFAGRHSMASGSHRWETKLLSLKYIYLAYICLLTINCIYF